MDTNSTPSSIIVRSYQPSDLPACQAIFTEAHLGYNSPMVHINFILQADMADIEKNYLQIPGGHWWVAVSTEDNRIVGQVAVLPMRLGDSSYYSEAPEEERDQICELIRMGIKQDVQRQGVGKKLLSTLINFARENGYRQIHLTTLTNMHKANAFYQRNGFIKGPIVKKPLVDIPENVDDKTKFISNIPSSAIFEVGAIIPDEDQRLMKVPISESKCAYIQHYSLSI
ncbi:unnamed protein product [Adineta steineri]|uniref:N-acetyltransferase domain-containing protein n=1 Tax=Adineta steineri TaxID=433720 RepID=A0A814JG30_9BILA|nr:unnamed protein product [Adineta steineri]CAF1266070.1 unnamed protein product [Adineta steineri]